MRSNGAPDGPPAESPDHPDRFSDDRLGHLARLLRPVDEDDRDLRDPEVTLPRAEAHLDLECVAVRTHSREVDRLEHRPAKALEATCRIPYRQTSYGPRIKVCAIAQDEPADRPVHDRYSPLLI